MKTVITRLSAMLVLLLSAATAGAQTTDKVVTFQVDMTAPINNCRFTPGTHRVFTPGSLNGWNTGQTPLTDPDGDKIYTGKDTIQVTTGRDTTFSWKFFAQPEAVLGWEDDPNRTYTLTAGQTNVTIPVVAYNKATTSGCTAQSANYEVVFSVDMSVAKLSGFNPTTDIVTVAGSMNGWNTTANPLTPDRRNPDIYTGIVNVDALEYPGTIQYKYVIGKPGEASPQGWESVSNRPQAVTGSETDTDANGRRELTVPTVYFNDVGPQDVFTQQTTITYEVDMRPAFYRILDKGSLPNDTQTGEAGVTAITGIYFNGPAARAADGGTDYPWGNGSGVPSRLLKDDGTQGDAVRGDSIYTVQFTYSAGSAKKVVGKFGVNNFDNEARAQNDHNLNLNTATSNRLRLVFGAMRRANGTLFDLGGPTSDNKAYDPYICIVADSLTASVARRGCGTAVAAEPVDAPSSTAFTVGNVSPNPANGVTRLRYALPTAQAVRVEVYDLLGRRLETVVDETQAAGTYDAVFDARSLSTGVYVYRVTAGGQVQNRTFVVNR